jgi:carbamoyltransferase
MIVLGITGAPPVAPQDRVDISPFMFHDGAAALVADGRLVAAAEEERFTRVKHTNAFPVNAIRYCLNEAGMDLRRVDRVAYYFTEAETNRHLWNIYSRSPGQKEYHDARELFQAEFQTCFGRGAVPPMEFIDHQQAHARCAHHLSGFDRCLVLCLDGVGDASSGVAVNISPSREETLARFTIEQSLGLYYLQVIRFLGYDQFDEYKVMGMAAYGDPRTYRGLFEQFYVLRDGGDYELVRPRVSASLLRVLRPNRHRRHVGRVHFDLAAALQESLERIVLHVLAHWRAATGQTRLSFAGGVALNSSLNGAIHRSGLFERVYVPPVPHDAGCAIGAALQAGSTPGRGCGAARGCWFSPYRGTRLGDDAEIERQAARWHEFISAARCDDVVEATAESLAAGKIVAWCQGRGELGPRALGNRSILADPRVASHRRVINWYIKEREPFRPLAPAVTVEDAADYFDIAPDRADCSYMSFVAQVPEPVRVVLPAVTHKDGTARLQMVSRQQNERFWLLLHAFGRRAGVPVLLNTSFNGRDEPIVGTLEDAITAFLTLPLHALIVGDWVVTRKPPRPEALLGLAPGIPEDMELTRDRWAYKLVKGNRRDRFATLSPAAFAVCARADGRAPLRDLLAGPDRPGGPCLAALLGELSALWRSHFLRLTPPAGGGGV